ncbi:GNAT family N-acetyltransferase [Candidatus Dojkabacteria bacterium]|nr:GNAT family N-acetyltransferase [Candidatus Dojkabacteria bacterium]
MDNQLYEIYRNSEEYKLWPINKEPFLNIVTGKHKNDINNETKVFKEYVGDDLAGYISIKVRESKGVICFLFVGKNHRNNGIGSKLLKQAQEHFRGKGVKEVLFGAGAGSYIFPGLPKNLNVEGFFKELGFEVTDKGLIDMYQDITNWNLPAGILEMMEEKGVKIAMSTREVAEKIVEFTKENFPNWYEYYRSDMEEERFSEVFYASIEDEIVGISELWMGECNWKLLFEGSVGGGAALGVSEKHRGKGIGLAMKAWGTQKIKEQGIKYVWIGWTYAVDFYRKLGFEVWREYWSVRKEIDPSNS